jgi:single-stranded-DNA-specific exonuclease recJ
LAKMEPFGNGNAEPILKITEATVLSMRRMGADGQHVKLTLRDKNDVALQMLAFNAPEEFFCEVGDEVSAWFQPTVNEWQGMKSVEGRLLYISGV